MSSISLFRNVASVTNPENFDIVEYLEKTRDGEWEDIVTQCRNIKDKEKRDAFKQKMPTATLSGLFDYRSDDKLVSHSGFISMDLDHVDNLNGMRDALQKDRYVFSVFMSTSGDGLRVIFKIESNKHREAFKALSQYIYENYGHPCDPNGINVSKPYVVSFDPYLYLNYNNVPVFKHYIKETVIKQMPSFLHTTEDFERVMQQITGRQINICESYDDWLKVGFALASELGEGGRSHFHTISQISAKYKHSVCEKQYTACLKARGVEKINISSFYYLAKINGLDIVSEKTKTVIRTTRNGKQAGLKKEQIVDNLEKFAGITGVEKLVEQIFDSPNKDAYTEEEQSILHQLELFISNSYSLRMNDVTGFLEENNKQLSPSDLNTIFIAAKKLMPKLDYNLLVRLLKSDFIERYNPFFEFFESDGIPVRLPATPDKNEKKYSSPLIDMLAQSIKNEDPVYTRYFLRKWMVSIISSAHKVHSPLLFCLLGAQNSGKTEFFRRLLPTELQSYYAESKLDKEKDDELLMCENLIVMDDELGGKSKSDAQKLKNITSKQYFSLRRPYGDHNEKILRLAVLCGTSNLKEVLNDTTGNRRIIPIEVTDIDKELYNSIDKKQLFMEAYRLYKEGFDWRINHKDISYLNKDQVKYEAIVKERELILKYFEIGDEDRLSSTEILVEIEKLTQQRLSINTMGRELENLGFEKKSTRIGQTSAKKWCVKRINRVEPLPIKGAELEMPSPKKPEEDDLPF